MIDYNNIDFEKLALISEMRDEGLSEEEIEKNFALYKHGREFCKKYDVQIQKKKE